MPSPKSAEKYFRTAWLVLTCALIGLSYWYHARYELKIILPTPTELLSTTGCPPNSTCITGNHFNSSTALGIHIAPHISFPSAPKLYTAATHQPTDGDVRFLTCGCIGSDGLACRDDNGVHVWHPCDYLYRHRPYLDCIAKHRTCVDGNYWTEDEEAEYTREVNALRGSAATHASTR